MSRKDHILIANAINRVYHDKTTEVITIQQIAEQLAYELKNDNHGFEKDKFIQACFK